MQTADYELGVVWWLEKDKWSIDSWLLDKKLWNFDDIEGKFINLRFFVYVCYWSQQQNYLLSTKQFETTKIDDFVLKMCKWIF